MADLPFKAIDSLPRLRARRVRHGGFTLIEVLIALAVVSISLAAIVKVGAETGYSFTHLRDRAMASWVASNRLTELKAMEYWGEGSDDGSSELAGREWYWETEIEETPIPELRRVTVRVYASEGASQPLSTLDGLLNHPDLRGPPGQPTQPGIPET